MYKLKNDLNKVVEAIKAIPNVWSNFQHLVESVSLVVVAGVAYWVTYNHTFSTQWQTYAVRFAAVVIALRGAAEVIRHLNKK